MDRDELHETHKPNGGNGSNFWATLTLGIACLISFFCHYSFRLEHFQEVDSSAVYNAMYFFPQQDLYFVSSLYPKDAGGLLTETQANNLLENSFVKEIIKKSGRQLTDDMKKKMISRLGTDSLMQILRYSLITLVSSLNLPHPLRAIFSLPWGTTYSPGPGLIYGLASSRVDTYLEFMNKCVPITLVVFHLSVVMLFFTLRCLKISSIGAVMTSLLYLFSLSAVRYSFHLGSTIWNQWSVFLWLWAVLFYSQKPQSEKTIGIISGVLFFFNYLISLFWLALMMIRLAQTLHQPHSKKSLWNLIWQQRWAVGGFLTGILLFYPPGQGNHGNITLATFPEDIFHILLNFFAVYKGDNLVNTVQFVLFSLLLLKGCTSLWIISPELPEKSLFRNLGAMFGLVYLGFFATGILGILPSRHILFATPLLFCILGFGVDGFLHQLSPKGKQCVLVFSMIAGLLLIPANAEKARDVTRQVLSFSAGEEMVVGDTFYSYSPKFNFEKIFLQKPIILKPGNVYLYVSQTTPFLTWEKKNPLNEVFRFRMLAESAEERWEFFTPFGGSLKRFPFNRPNNAYVTQFVVESR